MPRPVKVVRAGTAAGGIDVGLHPYQATVIIMINGEPASQAEAFGSADPTCHTESADAAGQRLAGRIRR